MMTLRVEGPHMTAPVTVYVVCGPTTGCGRAFRLGPSECPHCGQPTNVRASSPSMLVQLVEALINWEYGQQ